MSAEDVLDRATRALRDRTGGASSEAGRTRARVLAAAGQHGKRRRVAITLVPIAAVLAVSTAWADTHGWLASVWERVESTLEARSTPPTPPSAHRTGGPPVTIEPAAAEPVAATVPVVSVESLPRVIDPTPPSTPTSTSTPTPTSTSTSTSTSTLTPTSPPTDAPTLLYAAAHRAHFLDHDPAAALRAWDAYLLAAPDGTFAPEARYNRAIALIRLGRREDARRALAPFVAGTYGTYRTREAHELLRAIQGD